ncbi:MAG TPA: SdrD B-like domain-containing protein, partial [Anaerolineae bacterium]|nr:SdrD B-like domain-containing protein [Anaerolineae bacterium]
TPTSTSTPTPTATATRTATPTASPTGTATVGSIGGVAYVDSNGNGSPDNGEPRLGSVTVELKNNSGAVVATATTNSGGGYNFANLTPATYRVSPVTPADYFARPAEYVINLTAGTAVTTNLSHYPYLKFYLPLAKRGG